MEVFLAVAAGLVFILLCPQWLDVDEAVEPYWWILLPLGVGLAFGVFGRCPVLLIAPAFASVDFVLSMCGPSELWVLQIAYVAVLCLPVLIGAATGRGAQQYWKKREVGHAAQPDAPPNGGPATQLGGSGVAEGPPSVS